MRWTLAAALLLAACSPSTNPPRVNVDDLVDEDGDGWFVNDPSEDRADCDDRPNTGTAVFPGNREVCDGLDNNCDGAVDEDGAAGALEFWPDDDSDGFGRRVDEPAYACRQPDGYSINRRDCNDNDERVYPNAPERCNDKDDNCNLTVDEGFDPDAEWHRDVDGDSFGSAIVAGVGCNNDPLWVRDATDCNDVNAQVSPGAPEICDGIDNDCDNLVDGRDVEVRGTRTWYEDADGDAFGNLLVRTEVCPTTAAPAGFVLDNTDCNDADAGQNPTTVWFRDGDRDGFGVEGQTWPSPQCWQPIGYAMVTGDCNDAAADEWDAKLWYGDADRDGVGSGQPVFQGCGKQPGWVGLAGDCKDRDPAIRPGIAERCDGIDNDCDGLTDDADEEVVGLRTWYRDADGDTWGVSVIREDACAAPAGFVGRAGDCNDTEPVLNPGSLWFRDADRDGAGDPTTPSAGGPSCTVVPGHVPNDDDCDDTDYEATANTPWWLDGDGDGLGVSLQPNFRGCLADPTGYARWTGDCDDNDVDADEGGCFGPPVGNVRLTVTVDRDPSSVVVRLRCVPGGVVLSRTLTAGDRQQVLTLAPSAPLSTGDVCQVEVDTPGVDLSGDGFTQVQWSTCGVDGPVLVASAVSNISERFDVLRCNGCTDPAADNYDPTVLVPTNAQSCLYLD